MTYKPGQSGNPFGRRPGSRNRHTPKFLDDMNWAWEKYGRDALIVMAKRFPEKFVAAHVALEPKNVAITAHNLLSEFSDEELQSYLDALQRLEAEVVKPVIDNNEIKLIELKDGEQDFNEFGNSSDEGAIEGGDGPPQRSRKMPD